jgi:hypothetical protein
MYIHTNHVSPLPLSRIDRDVGYSSPPSGVVFEIRFPDYFASSVSAFRNGNPAGKTTRNFAPADDVQGCQAIHIMLYF